MSRSLGSAMAPECQQWTSFAALTRDVDSKALSNAAHSVFETPEWFENLDTTCADDTVTRLLLGVTNPAGCTVLPLWEHRTGKIESLSNFYTPVFNPACTDQQLATAFAGAFARLLAKRRAGTVQLHPLDPETPFWRAFVRALQVEGYWVDRYYASGNWHHPCGGVSWAEYLAGRPSRLRNSILRCGRKLQVDRNFNITVLDASTSPAAMQAAVADFKAVYAHSWKKPEPHARFIDSLCKVAHAQGWLRIGLCHLDGQAVAAQIWLVKAGVASIFKLAYDERQAKRGVGTVLSAALFKHVLDIDHVIEVDFLSGDDAYKAEWMSHRRERFGLIAFNPRTALGLWGSARHFGARALRRSGQPNTAASGRPARPTAA